MFPTKSKAGETEGRENPNKINFQTLQTQILLNTLTKVQNHLQQTEREIMYV